MPHMARSRSQSIRGQFKDAEGAEERQGDTEALMMSRCDLRMIHKLSKRVNVLPVSAACPRLPSANRLYR